MSSGFYNAMVRILYSPRLSNSDYIEEPTLLLLVRFYLLREAN